MNKHLLFGFGVDANTSHDPAFETLRDSLLRPTERIGIESALDENPLPQPWPATLQYNLRARIARIADYEAAFNETQKIQNISTRKSRSRELKKQYWVYKTDQIQFFNQAIYGNTPTRERFLHFWLNHFTVGTDAKSRNLIGDYIQNIIDPEMSGSFSDMLYSATTHVAMLHYLDNFVNIGENSKYAKKHSREFQLGLNDNLARELLELHTVSAAKDYTEDDIRALAKVLAGWFPYNLDSPNALKDIGNIRVPFSEYHAEPGSKIVLGKKYGPGVSALRAVTDDLANDDLTIQHLSSKLCKYFLSDEPSVKQTRYVADVWRKTDGNLPDVHTAVLELAYDTETKKFQSPLVWFLSMQKLSGATLIHGWRDSIEERRIHSGVYEPGKIMKEMGYDFWEKRQPNGFSSLIQDWVSSEHMERRIRLASMTYQFGRAKNSVDEMLEFLQPSKETIKLINSTKDERARFVMFFCSKEIMGV